MTLGSLLWGLCSFKTAFHAERGEDGLLWDEKVLKDALLYSFLSTNDGTALSEVTSRLWCYLLWEESFNTSCFILKGNWDRRIEKHLCDGGKPKPHQQDLRGFDLVAILLFCIQI